MTDDEESSAALSNSNETPLDRGGGESEEENSGDPVLDALLIVFLRNVALTETTL